MRVVWSNINTAQTINTFQKMIWLSMDLFFPQKVFQALICNCLKWGKVKLWPHQRWYTVFSWFNSTSAVMYHPFAVSLVSSFYDGSGVSRRFAVSFLRYTSSRVCSQGNGLKKSNLYHLQYFFSFYIFRKEMLVLLDIITQGEWMYMSLLSQVHVNYIRVE